MNESLLNKSGAIFILLCAAALLVLSYLAPSNRFDLLGYLGSALNFSIDDPVELLETTYSMADQKIPKDRMEYLKTGNEERKFWSSDPDSFIQLLPFYAPRVLVTYPAHLAHQLGFSPISYLRLQSSVAAAIGVLLLGWVMMSRLPLGALIVLPVLIMLSGVLEVARFEGGGALALAGFSLSTVLLLRKSYWAILILAVLPLTRSDMVLYSIPLLVYCFWVFRERCWLALIGIFLTVGCYFWANMTFDNYGWAVQFYVVQVKYLGYPADATISISMMDYLEAVFRGLVKSLFNYQAHVFFLTATVSLWVLFREFLNRSVVEILNNIELMLALLSVAYVVVHFLVFPSFHARYFSGQYFYLIIYTMYLFFSSERIATKVSS